MGIVENKDLLRGVIDEVINRKNLAAIDELFVPEYVDHASASGQELGREGFKEFAAVLFAAFPDFHVTIEDMLAEDDKVTYRGIVSGTHSGDFMGLHPTGRRFSVTEIHVDRIAGGRIVEHWGLIDVMGMLQQLGVVHEPEEPAG